MKVAILGWGSLIWNPQNLRLVVNENNQIWFKGGVQLPIEFARISSDGRLTLVIKDKADNVTTLFAISSFENLDEAILDLAIREGCSKNKIGYCVKQRKEICPPKFKYELNVLNWLDAKDDIDAVLWTNLSPNFKEKIGLELDTANAINYLRHLPLDAQVKAEEYLRKAPAIIDTPIRRAIIEQLKWKNIL